MKEITWAVSQGNPSQRNQNTPKVPYVSTWAAFSKLDEKTKASLFNAMRAELLASGKMENKGG